jgi:hypothetical protein
MVPGERAVGATIGTSIFTFKSIKNLLLKIRCTKRVQIYKRNMFWFQPTKLVTTSPLFGKAHYYQCIINELGINSAIGNRTYTPATFSKDEILQNHASVLNTLNIPGHVDDHNELPYLYWIPKLHKTPYKQRYIAGSKNVLQNLTKMLTAVKERLQMYCATVYTRKGVNQMWILKHSKELLESLKSPIFSEIYSIKT